MIKDLVVSQKEAERIKRTQIMGICLFCHKKVNKKHAVYLSRGSKTGGYIHVYCGVDMIGKIKKAIFNSRFLEGLFSY